jgi:putative transcriptional regulator
MIAMAEKKKPAPVVRKLIALRKRRKLSQPEFAEALRIPLATLRNWEQGRTTPDGATTRFVQLYLDQQTD